MSFSFGKQKGTTVATDPSLLSPEQRDIIINRLMNLTGQPTQGFGQVPTDIAQSPFFGAFQSALTDRFTPTAPEEQLLEDIMGRTSAGFARRGLGTSPIAASSTAASIAPSLIQLRQNRINELGNAITQWLGGQQLGLTQRGQDISSFTTQRGLTLQSLLNFLESTRTRPLGQQGGGGFNFGFSLPPPKPVPTTPGT